MQYAVPESFAVECEKCTHLEKVNFNCACYFQVCIAGVLILTKRRFQVELAYYSFLRTLTAKHWVCHWAPAHIDHSSEWHHRHWWIIPPDRGAVSYTRVKWADGHWDICQSCIYLRPLMKHLRRVLLGCQWHHFSEVNSIVWGWAHRRGFSSVTFRAH